MKLPYMSGEDFGAVRWQESFGGLDRRLGAPEGSIAAMTNMTGDHFPVMSPRVRRRKLCELTAPNGMGGGEHLFYTDGTDFVYNGAVKGQVAAGEKRYCCLGSYVTIWPDKKFFNTKTGVFGELEASVSAQNVWFRSARSPSGLSTEANCVHMPDADLSCFAPGQAVHITGSSHPEDNKTLVIREVSEPDLFFYDNALELKETSVFAVTETLQPGWYWFYDAAFNMNYNFQLTEPLTDGHRLVAEPGKIWLHVYRGDEETDVIEMQMGRGEETDTELTMESGCWEHVESGPVTVSREVPDLEYVCQCDNRLWGVWDNNIACSYLGDPRIWNNFDDTATACWQTEVGSPGAFTGAFSFGGYPLFFKEDHIYRIYGTKNANYQLFDTETLGCEAGSGKSFAVVGQVLYYKTKAGFAAYAGGVPKRIDLPLGLGRLQDAVGGTDGKKYYVSCRENTEWSLLVYDSELGLWHREDDTRALDMAWCEGELHLLDDSGGLWMIGRPRSEAGTLEDTVESVCELGDMPGAAGQKEAVQRLYFRLQAEQRLRVEIMYDSCGVWEKLTDISGGEKCVRTMELVPRRCDHFRLRLIGRGDWKLWALGRQTTGDSRMR